MSKNLPRGIRNNNPGNIEWGDPWQGLVSSDKRTDKRFCQFVSPAYGVRAMVRTLITYQDKHGIKTVSGAINRWAPPVENDTASYIRAVQHAVGGDFIDMHDYKYIKPLVESIIKHENGVGGLKTPNTWYSDDVINEGLRLAGVRPDSVSVSNVPVTKETVGASAAGAIGVVEIADVLPSIVAAIKSSEHHLISGQTVRVVLGLALVAASVVIAYSQIKKHRSGSL